MHAPYNDLAAWGRVLDREPHGPAPVGDLARVADGAGLPALGVSLLYLGLLVLIPLGSVFLKAYDVSLAGFLTEISSPRALADYRLSFGASLAAAGAATLLGLPVAWVLVRCSFPGRRVASTLVDLPFALPTAVAGLALGALFAHTGARAQATLIGVWVALVLVSSPFAIRTLERALRELDGELAVLSAIVPALLAGFTLAFARALAEYGSLLFLSANLPLETALVSYGHVGASATAVAMLVAAFALLFAVHLFPHAMRRRVRSA